jgi:hypothetical protein
MRRLIITLFLLAVSACASQAGRAPHQNPAAITPAVAPAAPNQAPNAPELAPEFALETA